MSHRRKLINFLGLVFVVFVLFAIIVPIINPPVTDPDDPRFDPAEFMFENYLGKKPHSELDTAVKSMFPLGTDKVTVDKVLVEKAGAVPSGRGFRCRNNQNVLFHYNWTGGPVTCCPLKVFLTYDGLTVSAVYTEDMKLSTIGASAPNSAQCEVLNN